MLWLNYLLGVFVFDKLIGWTTYLIIRINVFKQGAPQCV